jgi:hypothetical protein
MHQLKIAVIAFAIALGTHVARAADPVVAVLYVDNHSGDSAYDVLEKGLADMLARRSSTPRPPSRSARGLGRPMSSAARSPR